MQISPNFTPHCQKVIYDSKRIAIEYDCDSVSIEHLCAAIFKNPNDIILNCLAYENLDIEELLEFSLLLISSMEKPEDFESRKKPKYSKNFEELLTNAFAISYKLQCDYISIEHLLLSILSSDECPLTEIFMASNSSKNRLQKCIFEFCQSELLINEYNSSQYYEGPIQSTTQNQQSSPDFSFCTNLNERAINKKLNNVIGRDFEVSRCCEILSRKFKNNPILVGEPGVGKTAIVECLVQKIAKGDVPRHLLDKQVYCLDLAGLLAGTKYRGSFEEKIKKLLDFCSKQKNIILFIDEIHTIVGAGNAEGGLDAANILKQPLARGDITCIGATTYSEYKKYISKDSALARRFEQVSIPEPSEKETLSILKGIKQDFEEFHNVKYTDHILKKIVSLSGRYFPLKKFPDKAIDILDEAGALIKNKTNILSKEIKDAYKVLNDYNDQYLDKDKAENLLEKCISGIKSTQDLNQKPIKITEEDIISIISKKSGVPNNYISGSNHKNLLTSKQKIKRLLFGQNSVIEKVFEKIAASFIGLKNKKGPIASFLFLGKTGIGKTYTAELIASHVLETGSLVKFNMSEYSDSISANKLIGSAPGYVGHEEGGQLIDKIKKNPHSVILFDEIEKSTPSVFNLLLQMLEDGNIEDSLGNKVYLDNCIIILTGNLGSEILSKGSFGFGATKEDKTSKVYDEAKKILSPELVNRLSDIILFEDTSLEAIKKACTQQLSLLNKKLPKDFPKVHFDESFIDYISEECLNKNMGIRPLSKIIQKNVESKITSLYLSSKLKNYKKITFKKNKDEILIEKEEV